MPWKEPRELKVVTAEPQVVAARFSPCGKVLLASSYDARVRRWSAEGPDWAELPPLTGHCGWVTALACTAQGERLFSGDSWGQLRCTAYTGAAPAVHWTVAAAHDGWLREIAVSRDGSRLATCGIDKKVRLWSAADGAPQKELKTGADAAHSPLNGCNDGDVSCLRFTNDGTRLLTADFKGLVRLWDIATDQCVRSFDASTLFKLDRLQDVGGVRCLAVDKEEKWLAVGGTIPKNGGTVVGNPTLLVFDFATGELKHTLTFGSQNDCYVQDVTFHPGGMLVVATCGTPGTGQLIFQRLGEAQPLGIVKKMQNIQSVSLHPDGARLAVVATNSGSNGNGRPLTKDGKYEGNRSPIHILQLENIDISATFSIVAVDPDTGEVGAAVASKYPAVGKVVPYVRAGVGGFCTQHHHVPKWGEPALDALAKGTAPERVLADLLQDDPDRELRQLAIIDMAGRAAVHNPTTAPERSRYWAAMTGRFYCCQGNTLAGRAVVTEMARAYEETKGTLADRLIAALVAADRAGGDHRGKLAAGIRVAKKGVAGLSYELYVDQSDDAVEELARKHAEQSAKPQ